MRRTPRLSSPLARGLGLAEAALNYWIVPRSLYVPYFLCRVGLSYLGCRRFYEGAQSKAH